MPMRTTSPMLPKRWHGARRVSGDIPKIDMDAILPKKLTAESAVQVVHVSSRVEKRDLSAFESSFKKLQAMYPKAKEFTVSCDGTFPWYLAGSAQERVRRFREALVGMDWLCPAYGGTGCMDVVRMLGNEDLKQFIVQRPVVSGFSDATYLLNYLYFKTGLRTFHYTNAAGLFSGDSSDRFFKMLSGEIDALSFVDARSRWLSAVPKIPVAGIAIGGNLTTFRDLLDISSIQPETWHPYVLFIEDLDVDAEVFHRIIASLDARGVFKQIRGLVIGRVNEPHRSLFVRIAESFRGIPRGEPWAYIEHILEETLSARRDAGDPLPILKVENFGHGVDENLMIVPIGSEVVLKANGDVEFTGPFVE